uniref:Solute carrier family 46 member 3 n=1 Tax=Angiostrongylus cantonensis TaxID=6313 RepID=A0A0K0DDV6_ANGCA
MGKNPKYSGNGKPANSGHIMGRICGTNLFTVGDNIRLGSCIEQNNITMIYVVKCFACLVVDKEHCSRRRHPCSYLRFLMNGVVQNVRMPLIMGRVTAFVACCLYLSVELLPEGRRYLMLLCYFLFGIASSSSAVLRAYLAAVSTTQDRAKAYSAFVVATMLSIVIGPICQLIFASIRYPGFVLIEGFLMFHIYSAPIWIATFTNFISVAIIHYALKDVYSLKSTEEVGDSFNLENFKAWIRRVHSMDLNWPLIIVCWMERIVVSPFVMISYGWDGQKTVNVLSLCMGIVGVLAITIAVAFIFLRFGNVQPVFIFSLFASICTNSSISETLGTGCDTRQYTWCDTAYGTSSIVFLSVICVVMGIGVPMSAISLDTIYSKVLGNIDQEKYIYCLNGCSSTFS